jgi:hypothetical protein
LEASVGPLSSGAEIDLGTLRLAIQTLIALHLSTAIASNPIDILIKGFADGSAGEWTKPQESGINKGFRVIEVLPVAPGEDPDNPTKYAEIPEQRTVEDLYRNEDLPNLRAAYTKASLIEPYLRDCTDLKQARVRILDGYTFRKPNMPNERKVQIYVQFR